MPGGKVVWHSVAHKAVACRRSGRCTAVGTGGEVLTSEFDDQHDHLLKWDETILPTKDTPIEQRPSLDSVACPSRNVCLAGGIHGPNVIIASTTDFWTHFSLDEFGGVEGAEPTIKAFGCETVNRCVAVGSTALIGERKRG